MNFKIMKVKHTLIHKAEHTNYLAMINYGHKLGIVSFFKRDIAESMAPDCIGIFKIKHLKQE